MSYHFSGAVRLAMLAVAYGAMTTIAFADEIPDAVTASPDIYRVVAENDSLRVIEATWKPGQRDDMHSHPEIGFYVLSECDAMRAHFADGTSRDWNAKPGNAGANDPVESHAIENIGTTECKLVFVEPK